MFGVSESSADKVRHDINAILDAISRLCAKVDLPEAQKPLPPVQMKAELEREEPDWVTDAEVIEEPVLLTGHSQELLEGRDFLAVEASPPLRLLEPGAQAEVRLQIEETYIIALLPDGLRSQLEQLPPEKIEALYQALTQPPALAVGEQSPKPVIDLKINGVQQFHQDATGLVTVNAFYLGEDMDRENLSQGAEVDNTQQGQGQYALLLNRELSEEMEGTLYFTLLNQENFLYEYEGELDEALEDLPEIYEKSERQEMPHLELRPAAEVEALIGQDLGDASTLHQAVIAQAPVIEVVVDQNGQVKPGSYLRDQVEPTEDEVESEAQLEQTEDLSPQLTPQAELVIEQLRDYFQRTGEQELEGEHEYDFQIQGDWLLVLPKDNSGEVVAVNQDGGVKSTVSLERYEHLMERFAIAYEQLQVANHQKNSDWEIE